uniref:hypothetical protein n=1 Tax=uncultured Altererythrobacter sp. TaxID=500840 RepID=UPI002614EB2E|nr:hypothetical protein [uncultured Altererythrobacter sp.]
MSSRPVWWTGKSAPLLLISAIASPAVAQEVAPEYTPPSPPIRQPIDIEPIERTDTVDLLVEVPDGPADQRRIEQCKEEQDASTISRTIVVCREIVEDNSNYYSGSREDARDRFARETQYAGTLLTPDVAGPGIFKGPPTVGGLCIPGLQKCPPPPALIIDVEALPQAPAGSDADRIARGLPPIGDETGQENLIELDAENAVSSPEESEEPAGEQ